MAESKFDVLEAKISDMHLQSKVVKALEAFKITTVKELTYCSEDYLLAIPNLGHKCVGQLKQLLNKYDLTLGTPLPVPVSGKTVVKAAPAVSHAPAKKARSPKKMWDGDTKVLIAMEIQKLVAAGLPYTKTTFQRAQAILPECLRRKFFSPANAEWMEDLVKSLPPTNLHVATEPKTDGAKAPVMQVPVPVMHIIPPEVEARSSMRLMDPAQLSKAIKTALEPIIDKAADQIINAIGEAAWDSMMTLTQRVQEALVIPPADTTGTFVSESGVGVSVDKVKKSQRKKVVIVGIYDSVVGQLQLDRKYGEKMVIRTYHQSNQGLDVLRGYVKNADEVIVMVELCSHKDTNIIKAKFKGSPHMITGGFSSLQQKLDELNG